MKPRVLLLLAYAAASHRHWSSRLQQMFPEFAWTCLILPPRHFNWTIRGNSLLWGFGQQQLLQQRFDLLLATSMVDLSSLRGFVPALATIPTIVYFHENQFSYPAGAQRETNVEPQLVPLYAALCADRIVFNSNYNRSTFLMGTQNLFRRLPDTIPEQVIARLNESCVIPVPVPFPEAPLNRTQPKLQSGCLAVVWNHRWEYDKGIDLLLELCRQIAENGHPVRLHIAGEQFRTQPTEFQEIDTLLARHASQLQLDRGQYGFIADQASYETLLESCDVVLSTARHDFQGLAVQEACMHGCTPLAPADLAYPEYLGPEFLYPASGAIPAIAAVICARLLRWQAHLTQGKSLPKPDLSAYGMEALQPRYAKLFAELLEGLKH